MITTIIFYTLICGLLIWGLKFSGVGKFHENFFSLDVSKALQGFAALCIIFHHISQQGAFRQTKTLGIFPEIGFLFVGVFFFCSGFGLIKSIKTKPGYLDHFLKKRVLPLVIAYYIMNVVYILSNIIHKVPLHTGDWILGILGLSLLNSFSWYIIAIVLLYLVFNFVFKKVKSQKNRLLIMFLVVVLQGVFCMVWGHFAWWTSLFDGQKWWLSEEGMATAKWWMRPMALLFQGEWWANSTVAFFVGMLVSTHEESFNEWLKKKWLLKFVALTLITAALICLGFYVMYNVSYWTEFSTGEIGIPNKLICFTAQFFEVSSVVLWLYMFLMKVRTLNPVLAFLGKHTLEIYLMQLLAIRICQPLIQTKEKEALFWNGNWNLALNATLIIALTMLFAVIYKWALTQVNKRIK